VSKTRLVVFDLDGTLVDSTLDLATAVNAMLAALAPGTPPLPVPVVRSLVGQGAANLVGASLRRAGLPHGLDAALPLFLERYSGCLLETTRLYPGVAEDLAALQGFERAVLSNKPGAMCRAILEGLGVASQFARIWGFGDFPGRKPEPGPLLALMRELGASPTETVLVGDSAVDVLTARAAGVRVLGVSWGLDPESLRQEPPDAMLGRLSELRDLC
jgi:phosphoglycolate phosphatase